MQEAQTPTSMDSQSQQSSYSGIEGIATIPRSRQRQGEMKQVFEHGTLPPRRPHSAGAINPVYDHLPARRQVRYDSLGNAMPLPQVPKEQHATEPIYQSRSTLDKEQLKSILYGSQEKMLEEDESYVDDNANEQTQRRLSKPELRQFSREPTVIRISQLDNDEAYSKYTINDIRDGLDQIQIQVKEPSPTPQPKTPKTPLSPPRRSRSSSSPEWPPPPEPIGPISPETPVNSSGFDSNTLKRMLRSLPESSPENENDERDHGYQEGTQYQQPRSTASSPIRGATIFQMHGSPKKIHSGPSSRVDLASLPPTEQRPPIPTKPVRYSVEYPTDLPYRGARTRDSYPDSGVSGMSHETTGSVKSGDSGRSARSSKSATLPPGEY